MSALRDDTTRRLHRTTLERQRKGRLPGVFAGVVRGGGLVWHDGIGAAHLDHPDRAPGPDDQFLIASNTKTFTAVLVMRLRDEGKLSLDDTLNSHVPDAGHGGLTLRQCLAHVSGMQREPLGDDLVAVLGRELAGVLIDGRAISRDRCFLDSGEDG